MARMLHSSPARSLAVLLAVVLVLTLATPAKAEAFDVMTGLAIAGAAIILIVLVTYLVIANVEGPKTARPPALDAPPLALAAGAVAPPALALAAAVRESP